MEDSRRFPKFPSGPWEFRRNIVLGHHSLLGMETRTAVVLALGAAAVYAAYVNPALGAAIGIGAVVIALLWDLMR
jgi:hypothetical protein